MKLESGFRLVPTSRASLVLQAFVAGALSVRVPSCAWACLVSCSARVRLSFPVTVLLCSMSRVSTTSEPCMGSAGAPGKIVLGIVAS